MKNNIAKTALLLLLTFMTTAPAWAQLSGSGTAEDPYLITSDADWITFCNMGVHHHAFTLENADHFRLTADITATKYRSLDFAGEFDGNGHTITISYGNNKWPGLFYGVTACLYIHDLKVQGTIFPAYSSAHNYGGANKTLYKPVLFPHVKETLMWLQEQGIKMTVASSRTTFSLHDLLKSLGIADYFDYVLGSEDVTRSKPDPEPVLKTLGKMNVDAARTLVVGDMAVDIMMGASAGCKTCGVTYGNGTREELAQSGAEFIINDMAELDGVVGE